MAVPKKKKSYSRTRQRRNNKNITPVMGNFCSNCGSIAHSHNICEKCGFYKGRQVVSVTKDKKFVQDTSEFTKISENK